MQRKKIYQWNRIKSPETDLHFFLGCSRLASSWFLSCWFITTFINHLWREKANCDFGLMCERKWSSWHWISSSFITWNLWLVCITLWAWNEEVVRLWGKGSNLTGTDILDSQQQEPFPHQESRWRILELVFLGHANEHPPPVLIFLPHLTPWTTTSFFNIVPRWLPRFHAPVYGFRLFLSSIPQNAGFFF